MAGKKQNTATALIQNLLNLSGTIAFLFDQKTQSIEWYGDGIDALNLEPNVDLSSTTTFQNFIHPMDLPLRAKAIDGLKKENDVCEHDYRLRSKSGAWITVQEKLLLTSIDKDGYKICLSTLSINHNNVSVSDNKGAASGYVTEINEVTGLMVRSALLDKIAQTVELDRQNGYFITVGIDHLGQFEEAYGDSIAEEILSHVAKRIERIAGKDIVIGHASGDVYGLFLNGYSKIHTDALANQIISSFAEVPLQTSIGPKRITVSIGACAFAKEANLAIRSLISKAEAALKEAQNMGQSFYKTHGSSETNKEQYRQWIQTSEDFVRAMKEDRVALAFQAVVDSNQNNDVYFHECLIRMLDHDGKPIPAGLFFPAVEKMGLSRLADKYAVTLAIRELEQFPELTLSVNVSNVTVLDPDWLGHVVEMLKGKPNVAQRLVVEITESSAMKDLDTAMHFIQTVQDLGCRIALDDFGAGYTSFSQLDQLNIDIVKVDSSFVRGMSERKENMLFMQAMRKISNGFNLDMVAEGIETMDEAKILTDDGIHRLQGYAFDMPTIERSWANEKDSDLLIKKT